MSSVYSSNYSYNYYLRNAYSSNRSAGKSQNRGTLSNNTLVSADSNAVKKMSDQLRGLEYSSDNATSIYRNVKAYIETYNNLIDTSSESSSSSIKTQKKMMTKLTQDEKDELENIGITINSKGELSMDSETFLKSSPANVKKVFSQDNNFTLSVKNYATKINKLSSRLSSVVDVKG